MNWAVKLSITRLSITERVVTVAERVRCSAGTLYTASSSPEPSPEPSPERSPERAPAGTTPEQRRRCAVVIDRDPEVVKGLSALLMPQLDVQSAVCPLSGALLLDRLEHVDLAFVELELPDFAGEQLLQQLGRWPDAIRVLLTQHAPNLAAREPSLRSQSLRGQASSGQASSGQAALAASALPRNAYLAHLVLSKPVSAQVVRALQRATLGLLRV